jgi:hypothetical protein
MSFQDSTPPGIVDGSETPDAGPLVVAVGVPLEFVVLVVLDDPDRSAMNCDERPVRITYPSRIPHAMTNTGPT